MIKDKEQTTVQPAGPPARWRTICHPACAASSLRVFADFFDLVHGRKDVITLGVGEPDFVTPWHVREAAVYGLEKGKTQYTSNAGMPELREAIAAYLANRFDVQLRSGAGKFS